MHKIQEGLKNVVDLPDDELLELVISGWETVCEENSAQKHLVTASQLSAWENFQESQNAKIQDIVESFDEDGVRALSENDRAVLVNLASMITQATHKTEDAIVEEAREKAFTEQNLTKSEKKVGWGKRLKFLFNSLRK